MKVTENSIINAYAFFLSREPENAMVVRELLTRFDDESELIAAFVNSKEFRERHKANSFLNTNNFLSASLLNLQHERKCKICDGDAQCYDIVDFNKSCDSKNSYPLGISKIPVPYYCCKLCGFLFTDFCDFYGAKEFKEYIYNEDYIKVDPEYLSARPMRNARLLCDILTTRKNEIIGIDYGGGGGITSAEMRLLGYNYDTLDAFGVTNLKSENHGKYNFCSAFEVFEHLPNPRVALQEIIGMMDNSEKIEILIGTGLSDDAVSDERRLMWWYASPRNGHISLFSKKSMEIMADNEGCQLDFFDYGCLLTKKL